MTIEDDDFEGGEMAVPPHLLDLYVQMEDGNVTPEEFKEAYDAEVNSES